MLALGNSFRENPEAVTAVMGLLDDEGRHFASDSASLLTITGKHLDPAVPEVIRLLKDSNHAPSHAMTFRLLGETCGDFARNEILRV